MGVEFKEFKKTFKGFSEEYKIKTIEIKNDKTDTIRRYFNKLSILENIKNTAIVKILNTSDSTPYKGYINASDFLLVAQVSEDAKFYLSVQKSLVKQTRESEFVLNFKSLMLVARAVGDKNKYKALVSDEEFYNDLQQDMLHDKENYKMTIKETEEWNEAYVEMRKQRRRVKEDKLFSDIAREFLSLEHSQIQKLELKCNNVTRAAGKDKYIRKVSEKKMNQWKNEFLTDEKKRIAIEKGITTLADIVNTKNYSNKKIKK